MVHLHSPFERIAIQFGLFINCYIKGLSGQVTSWPAPFILPIRAQYLGSGQAQGRRPQRLPEAGPGPNTGAVSGAPTNGHTLHRQRQAQTRAQYLEHGQTVARADERHARPCQRQRCNKSATNERELIKVSLVVNVSFAEIIGRQSKLHSRKERGPEHDSSKEPRHRRMDKKAHHHNNERDSGNSDERSNEILSGLFHAAKVQLFRQRAAARPRF